MKTAIPSIFMTGSAEGKPDSMASDAIDDDIAPEVASKKNGWLLADGKDMVDEVEVIHEERDEKVR